MSSGHVRIGYEKESAQHYVLGDHNFYRTGGLADEVIGEFSTRVSHIRGIRIKQAYGLGEDIVYRYNREGD